MEFSIFTLFGQILGVLFVALIVYLIVLIPISLKKIVGQLAGIKDELRKQNKQSGSNREV